MPAARGSCAASTITQVGKQVASPLVTAYSDPSLPGYGHYAYDHEGTPARRVVHIDRGVFRGFMNSRQTAAVFGGEPNGHWKATEAALVPLIRMSSTVFAAGDRAPADIIREVDHGYYLVGHKIPSIAESRENFRISARKVYEIDHGGLGRLYRDGGIMADSRDYLMKVDAVGRRFSPLPHSQLRQGTTHADQEARQWRPDHAEPRHHHRRAGLMKRLVTILLVAVALFWVSPAPADDPEVPEKYISVDEVKALLEQKKPVTFIDVRQKAQFDDLHIRGAINIPLGALPARLAEISRRTSSSSTEPARTRWPGGPTRSCTPRATGTW